MVNSGMNKKDNKKIVFVILFAVLGLITLQIPFSKILGSSQNFTLFEFFAPTVGLFLNSFFGAISVLLVKIFDMIFIKHSVNLLSVLRLLPLPLAAFYFGSKSKYKGLIGVLCIVLFNLNPVGRQAWLYSMYWLIPVAASLFPDRLFLKSLGSTFTAHGIGSVIFLYSSKLTSAMWLGLIPVTFMERVHFAIGIYVSCIVFNFVLDLIVKHLKFGAIKSLVKEQYLPSKKFLVKFS